MIHLFLAAFVWSTSFVAGKFAYEHYDPYLVVQLRLTISALALLPLWRSSFSRVPRRLYGDLLFLAFVNAVTFLLQFVGLSMTSASSAVAMLGVEPIVVIFVGALFFGESASRANVLLGLLAIMGVWVIAGFSEGGDVSAAGCLLVLASTVTTALWVHISKRVLRSMSSMDYTVVNVALSVFACLPLTLFFKDSWSFGFDPGAAAAIVYLALVCSLGALWLWNKGLSRVEANHTGVFLTLEPVFGIALSAIVLGEALPFGTVLGAGMVLLAALLTGMIPNRERAASSASSASASASGAMGGGPKPAPPGT